MSAGKSTRRLVENVCVHKDGEDHWFGPDYDGGKVPKAMASLIENPDVWGDGEDDADADGSDDAGGSDAPGSYDGMKVAELNATIEARNFGRGDDGKIVPAGKTKGDLAAALEADDAANPSTVA